MNCIQCGRILETTGELTHCNKCKNSEININGKIYSAGWICPMCFSIYSPKQIECYRCNNPEITNEWETSANIK